MSGQKLSMRSNAGKAVAREHDVGLRIAARPRHEIEHPAEILGELNGHLDKEAVVDDSIEFSICTAYRLAVVFRVVSTKAQRRRWQQNWELKHPERFEAYKKKNLAAIKARYRNDPEFRQRKKEYAVKWSRKNRAKINKRRRTSPQLQATQRRWTQSEVGRRSFRKSWLKTKYGITLEQYEAMLARQGSSCAICGSAETVTDRWRSKNRRLRVDHDHVTKLVRGLLCHHCNAGMGHFKDDPELLLKAIAYLQRHGRKIAPLKAVT